MKIPCTLFAIAWFLAQGFVATLFAQDTSDFSLGVRDTAPLSAQDENNAFTVPAGFSVRLFAAEPDIAKPLNMAFDQRGRLWLTNTVEYPYPVKVGPDGLTPNGRDSIKILEDTTGDGKADLVTTFADGLNIPIGLYPYQDGVICFSIPHIWFLRDTNGDGICDKREILLGPFDHTRDAHGLCNAFTRGYDGWLYACHGFNNQSSVSGSDGNRVTLHSGNTFRFQPDGSRIEHFTHGQVNPFGISYDARGDLLTADCHTKPISLLMRGGYYESFGKPHNGLGFVPNVMEHLHGSTAIGGIAVTPNHTSWPTSFRNNALGGNVMTSRIIRNQLTYHGSSLRALARPDFLISADPWFRPVDLQIGPNGDLFIADFYNRIIGHYEVPLEHPGRDRTRGRIWRVSYTDVVKPTADLTKMTASQLIAQFENREPQVRQSAADRVVDHFGTAVAPQLEDGLKHPDPLVKIQCAWCLFCLDLLQSAAFDGLLRDDRAFVRMHGFKILAELKTRPSLAIVDWLVAGLADSEPVVRRAAAIACKSHDSDRLLPAILSCFRKTDPADVHLHHALKLAAHHQLQHGLEPKSGERPHVRDEATVRFLISIYQAIPTKTAAEYIISNLEALPAGSELQDEAIRHAAKHAAASSLDDLAKTIQRRFQDDQTLQVEALAAVTAGLQEQGSTVPSAIRSWALSLANQLLALDASTPGIGWQSLRASTSKQPTQVWAVSKTRKTTNGLNIPLWSSYPNGEQRTGTYRSDPFQLGNKFGFYIAGHDGVPQEAMLENNFVRLRDAHSHEVIRTCRPPRQDDAILQEWDTASLRNRLAYVELVDSNSDPAFAWMAVGGFSQTGLNPHDLLKQRRSGFRLISDLQLHALKPQLCELLRGAPHSGEMQNRAARTLASLQSSATIHAIAETVSLRNLPPAPRRQAIDVLCNQATNVDQIRTVLDQAFRVAATLEQRSLAEHLSVDVPGIGLLLQLIEDGAAGAYLLTIPAVHSNLLAIGNKTQIDSYRQLVEQLPESNGRTNDLIEQKTQLFLRSNHNQVRGRTLFDKHCSVCHQVNGKGRTVGPNLDGIGNRGLARLTEDVLAPNRNVDVAFRAATVVTTDGKAHTGLLRRIDSNHWNIVDSAGSVTLLAPADVEHQLVSVLSPMPSNFDEVLADHQFTDLMSYLLSLRE